MTEVKPIPDTAIAVSLRFTEQGWAQLPEESKAAIRGLYRTTSALLAGHRDIAQMQLGKNARDPQNIENLRKAIGIAREMVRMVGA